MIKIIILSFMAGAVSCGSGTTIAENAPPMSAQSPAVSGRADIKGPSEVVEEFMALVSSGEVEKARAIFTPDSPKSLEEQQPLEPSNLPQTGQDAGSLRLDWAGYFSERGFRLGKVLSTQSERDKADVKAELGVEDSKTFRQGAVFHLEKHDGRWLIADIEIVFDKPSDIKLNSNVSG